VPELPEVENVRRSLTPHLVGRLITRARLLRADVCTSFGGKALSSGDLLAGGRVVSIERLGKQLAIVSDTGHVLSIHLGMTGQVLVRASAADQSEKHVHAVWTVNNPATFIIFKDPRRFGGLWTFPDLASLRAHRWSALGPDALDAAPETWADGLRAGKRAVKAAMLDQAVVAGIGNIYADEALFRAGIRPTTPTCRVPAARAVNLAFHTQKLLAEAVQAGGSTLRDYRNADGESGFQQLSHKVYGRGHQPCLRCDKHLHQGTVAQRTTVWCPSCQPVRLDSVPPASIQSP
jgi:formamidopyrimidine-DNA glycosylase